MNRSSGRYRRPIVLLLVGLVLLISGVFKVVRTSSDQSHFAHPTTTQGTVVGTRWERKNVGHHRYARVESPQVRFSDAQGKTHTFWGTGVRWEYPTIGGHQDVQYDPKDPSYARTSTGSAGVPGWQVWGNWLIAGGGALVVVLALYTLVRANRDGDPSSGRPAEPIQGPYQAGPASAPNPSASAPPAPPMSAPAQAPQQAGPPPAPQPTTAPPPAQQAPPPQSFRLPGQGQPPQQ